MNPRLEKLRQEREKLAEKLTSLTARLKALDEQILKLENTDIVGIVRENGLTIEQLAALMASRGPLGRLPMRGSFIAGRSWGRARRADRHRAG